MNRGPPLSPSHGPYSDENTCIVLYDYFYIALYQNLAVNNIKLSQKWIGHTVPSIRPTFHYEFPSNILIDH